ncbi:pentatricopeptide repeat (PPR) superfamily protein [Actinidia rufa]|uniref:Pentatricopeptide repeat (PPR) superfamily protein n=1 Tax=Actinidia rufa TaxID=165716 RepID=A0A7J0FHZ5_9ERIC|nr:pentatricopeptide repeat (PPR) superfamily protein [Actinidia rufa]
MIPRFPPSLPSAVTAPPSPAGQKLRFSANSNSATDAKPLLKKKNSMPTFSNQSSIVDMYAKCGLLDSASLVFESIYQKSSVSLTAVISGYVRSGAEIGSC